MTPQSLIHYILALAEAAASEGTPPVTALQSLAALPGYRHPQGTVCIQLSGTTSYYLPYCVYTCHLLSTHLQIIIMVTLCQMV